MFSLIIFVAVVSVVLAGQQDLAEQAELRPDERGFSTNFRRQDTNEYTFGYNINDQLGAFNGRRESGDLQGNKFGTYQIRDIDGRIRTVNYVADKDGFRARIDTNEPGLITHQAADAFYNGHNVLRVNHGQGFGAKGANGPEGPHH